MTKIKKVVEYLVNLCYYLDDRREIEVMVMQNAIIGVYNEITKDKVSKNINFWSSLFYLYKLKKFAKKIDWSLYVEHSTDICGGNTVIKGTRIMPEIILERFKIICNSNDDISSSMLLTKIKNDYPALSTNDILMAILYTIHKKGLRILFK